MLNKKIKEINKIPKIATVLIPVFNFDVTYIIIVKIKCIDNTC